MSHFMGVGIFRVVLTRTDLGCWRLTLSFQIDIVNVMKLLVLGEKDKSLNWK